MVPSDPIKLTSAPKTLDLISALTLSDLFCFSTAVSHSFSAKDTCNAKMQNEEGQNMDLYIPRKCSATNRLITSKDHASVQINLAHLDERGVHIPTSYTTFALCGYVRAQGDADSGLDRLWQKRKVEVRQN